MTAILDNLAQRHMEGINFIYRVNAGAHSRRVDGERDHLFALAPPYRHDCREFLPAIAFGKGLQCVRCDLCRGSCISDSDSAFPCPP
jgi:hypothetical protein